MRESGLALGDILRLDDDLAEAAGSEDEENNSYSIGGDRHNDLEEDHA